MGSGYFSEDTRTLNLRVSFTLQNPNLMEWMNWFSWGSEMLSIATEGQVRIGAIVYTIHPENDSIPSGTDIIIAEGSHGETNKFAGLGEANMRVTIGDAHLGTPGVLVHELGHHLYGLGDEYIGYDPNDGWDPNDLPPTPRPTVQAFCVDDDLPTCTCVMQRSAQSILFPLAGGPPFWPDADSAVTNFCATLPVGTDSTHGALSQLTIQEDRHGESCWQTMSKTPATGTMPPLKLPLPTGTAKPDLSTVPQAAPVQMVEAQAGSRFVLALDRSWSMNSDNKIAGVRHAAHAWINLEALLGNELAIVSFETSAHTDLMLGQLAPPATVAHDAAGAITPGGATNITAALERADSLLGNPQAANQAILLFSDGINTVGDEPGEPFLTNLKADLDVYTLSFGPDADITLMEEIATGGKHHHVDTPADPLRSDFDINFGLCYFASELHSAPLAAARFDLGSAREQEPGGRDEPASEANLELAAALSTDEIARLPNWFELEVLVEPSVRE